MAIDTTRQLIQQITNASSVGENTATRVGNAMEAMLNDVKAADDKAVAATNRINTTEQGIANANQRLTTEEGVNAAQSAQIEGLKQDIQNIRPVTIEGDVVNNPDNVFLTSANDEITPKERTTSLSAKGHYIMRPTDNFAAKLKANYIHEIPFDVDLGGASVTIPAGAVLKFTGSRITNGTLVGNNTAIDSNEYLQCDLDGTFIAREGVIKSSNMANVLAHIKTTRFNVAEDVTIASGFDTQTIADTTIDGQGHTLNIPSLSISTPYNVRIANANFVLSEYRTVNDKFSFGILGNGNAEIENSSFTGLQEFGVYLRGRSAANVRNCKFSGTGAASSRTGHLCIYSCHKFDIKECSFTGMYRGVTVMGGTDADKTSSFTNSAVTDCDRGFVAFGGTTRNLTVANNVFNGCGIGSSYDGNINIHHMDGIINIIDNVILNGGGSIFDLDASINSAPDPDTNPVVLVRGNRVEMKGTTSGISLWMIPNVRFDGNIVTNFTNIGTRNCKNLAVTNNILAFTTKLFDLTYNVADTYELNVCDNVLRSDKYLAMTCNLAKDDVTVNAEMLRNTAAATTGTQFRYNIQNKSSVRVFNAISDWNPYDVWSPVTYPTTLDQFYIINAAYQKVSFDLSKAAGQTAFTFFAQFGVYVNSINQQFVITMSANGQPKLQSLSGLQTGSIRLFYEWNADTKILDLYFIIGAQHILKGWLMLATPNAGKNFGVIIRRASTTVAVAETKTRLYAPQHIEKLKAADMVAANGVDNEMMAYNLSEGLIVRTGGYTYNYLGLRANKLIGATADRPTGLGTAGKGYQFFDTTINLPIWWNGSAWIKSDGTSA